MAIDVAPAWALVRDGAAVSRTAYSALFDVLCPIQNGTTTNASNVITGLTSTRQLSVGTPISGAGIPSGATVASITSASAITISANATVTGTNALRIFPYGAGDGSTTFNVMNDQELFDRAYSSTARGFDNTIITGTITNASSAITALASTVGLYIGQPISGIGIPGGATVASITSTSAITISTNATASNSGVSLTFNGRAFGTEQADDFKSHFHVQNANTAINLLGGPYSLTSGGSTWSLQGNTLNTGGAESRPRNRAYLPLIVY